MECELCTNSTHCSQCNYPLAAQIIDRTVYPSSENGCFVTSIANCQQFIVDTGKIICTVCFDGYYLNEVNATKVCTPCNKYCSLCSGGADGDCFQCQPTFGITPSCTCSSGYFSLDTECIPCQPGCDICETRSANLCFEVDLSTPKDICTDGQYKDESGDYPVCGDCHIFCDGCKGPSQFNCTKCSDYVYPITNTTDNCTCKTNYTYSEYIDGFCECTNITRYSAIIRCNSKCDNNDIVAVFNNLRNSIL